MGRAGRRGQRGNCVWNIIYEIRIKGKREPDIYLREWVRDVLATGSEMYMLQFKSFPKVLCGLLSLFLLGSQRITLMNLPMLEYH